MIKQTTHKIDATGQAPGRLASEIAHLLMGKHKASFVRNQDMGDAVSVSHASKMKISGKKLDQKTYKHHTRYGHGLRVATMKHIWTTDPSDILRRSVSRMLPKNTFRTERLKRLRIVA